MTAHDAATSRSANMSLDAATNPAEIQVRIGRLVIDAPSAGAAGLQRFEAELQAALARRLGGAAPTGPDPLRRGFDTAHAVADAVAARLRTHTARGAKG